MEGLDSSELSIIEKLTKQNREATKIDFDKIEQSPDTENASQILGPELMSNIENHDLDIYLSTRLNTRYKSCKKMLNSDIMKWQREQISKPILRISSTFSELAIQIFKNLLSYMGDRLSSKKPLLHVLKFIRLTMPQAEELKDEAYVQVIKQISYNLDEEKCRRGWNFFAILASCYPPSYDLYLCLLNYLFKIINEGSDQEKIKRSNYIAIRLYRTFTQKRKFFPFQLEIEHIEAMKPIILPIYFYSGASVSIPIESYTTIRELKTMVMRKLQLNLTRIPYYSMYEICDKVTFIEKRFLDESSKIVDIITVWKKEEKDYEEKQHMKIDFKIYLQIQLYYKYSKDDIDTVTMHYVQTNNEVLFGQYNLTDDEISQLGALSLYINNYNNKSHEELYNTVKDEIKNYIPNNKLKDNNTDEGVWAKKIMDAYTTLQPKNRLEAKNKYLELLENNILYESYQFFCKFSKNLNTENTNSRKKYNPDHITDDCIVAVKPNKIVITDDNRNELLDIPFNIIASWGINAEIIVIVTRTSETEYTKYYFENNQTKVFQILMDSYTSMLSDKGINEIITRAENTCKMFDSKRDNTLKGQTLRSFHSTVYKK